MGEKRDRLVRMTGSKKFLYALVLSFFFVSAALALEVETDKSVIYPTAIGDTKVWSDYVTISVRESGKPVQNASVSIKTESDILVSTATTDANGSAMLSVLLRSPYDLSIFVNEKDSGKRIQLLGSGEQKAKEEQKTQTAGAGTGTFDLSAPLIFISVLVVIAVGALWWKKKKIK